MKLGTIKWGPVSKTGQCGPTAKRDCQDWGAQFI